MLLVLLIVFLVLFVVLPVVGLTLGALLSTAIVGLVVGALGRLVVPGRQRMGLLATILCGLCGAIVGGYLGDRVLFVGGFPTALLEIGVAALVVAAVSRGSRHSLSRLR